MLADVGGFNDGLLLLCSIFMSSYSAFSFTLDVLSQFPVDVSKSSQGLKSEAEEVGLQHEVEEISPAQQPLTEDIVATDRWRNIEEAQAHSQGSVNDIWSRSRGGKTFRIATAELLEAW